MNDVLVPLCSVCTRRVHSVATTHSRYAVFFFAFRRRNRFAFLPARGRAESEIEGCVMEFPSQFSGCFFMSLSGNVVVAISRG